MLKQSKFSVLFLKEGTVHSFKHPDDHHGVAHDAVKKHGKDTTTHDPHEIKKNPYMPDSHYELKHATGSVKKEHAKDLHKHLESHGFKNTTKDYHPKGEHEHSKGNTSVTTSRARNGEHQVHVTTFVARSKEAKQELHNIKNSSFLKEYLESFEEPYDDRNELQLIESVVGNPQIVIDEASSYYYPKKDHTIPIKTTSGHELKVVHSTHEQMKNLRDGKQDKIHTSVVHSKTNKRHNVNAHSDGKEIHFHEDKILGNGKHLASVKHEDI